MLNNQLWAIRNLSCFCKVWIESGLFLIQFIEHQSKVILEAHTLEWTPIEDFIRRSYWDV